MTAHELVRNSATFFTPLLFRQLLFTLLILGLDHLMNYIGDLSRVLRFQRNSRCFRDCLWCQNCFLLLECQLLLLQAMERTCCLCVHFLLLRHQLWERLSFQVSCSTNRSPVFYADVVLFNVTRRDATSISNNRYTDLLQLGVFCLVRLCCNRWHNDFNDWRWRDNCASTSASRF